MPIYNLLYRLKQLDQSIPLHTHCVLTYLYFKKRSADAAHVVLVGGDSSQPSKLRQRLSDSGKRLVSNSIYHVYQKCAPTLTYLVAKLTKITPTNYSESWALPRFQWTTFSNSGGHVNPRHAS